MALLEATTFQLSATLRNRCTGSLLLLLSSSVELRSANWARRLSYSC